MRRASLIVIAVMIEELLESIQRLGTVKTEFFPLGDRNQTLV